MFTIKSKGSTIAHVHKKILDLTGSFWVEVSVDPSCYDAEAFKDLCLTILAACIVMIQILHVQDRENKRRERREALDKLPLQVISSASRKNWTVCVERFQRPLCPHGDWQIQSIIFRNTPVPSTNASYSMLELQCEHRGGNVWGWLLHAFYWSSTSHLNVLRCLANSLN